MGDVGGRLGHYRIERMLGAGGMGEVYLAFDERLERRVALKVLPATHAANVEARGRMLREARAASALHHPGIVTIYEIAEVDGRAFLVMELVEGETLAALIARRRLPPAEALALFEQIGDALRVAHEAGILHRDVKAANLMLDRHGRVRVLDFGLSKRVLDPTSTPPATSATNLPQHGEPIDPAGPTVLPTSSPSLLGPPASGSADPVTAYGARMGTPGYAAPELLAGEDADVRSDVYSLAVVLYELLTGRRPYDATTWRELREQMDAQRHPPASTLADGVSARLDAVIAKALAPRPDARHASVAALCADARAALRPSRRGRALVAGALVIAIAGGAIVIGAGGGSHDATGAPAAAAATVLAPDAGPPPGRAQPGAAHAITSFGGCVDAPVFVDAKTIAFGLTLGDAVDLWVADLGGAAPRRLTSAPTWEWRPAAGRGPGEIVYVETNTEDSTKSAIVALDVASAAERARIPVFTAGAVAIGDTIYYSATDGTELRRRRGTDDVVIATMPPERVVAQLVASPRRDRLAFEGTRAGLGPRVCTISPVDPRAPDCLAVDVLNARPAFSADGRAIYVATPQGIVRHALDGRGDAADETVLPGVRAPAGVTVSPDGATLAWSDCEARSSIVDLSASPPSTLVDDAHARSPVIGPAGQLAWVRDDGVASILVARTADGARLELTNPRLGRVTGPAFDASGTRLAFAVGGAHPGLYVTSARGGAAPSQLTDGRDDEFVVWTEDEHLAFTRYDDQNLPHVYLVDLEGHAPARISNLSRQTAALDRATGEVVMIGAANVTLWDPKTRRERNGPSLPSGDVLYVSLAPNGKWLLLQTGLIGQTFWRAPLEPHASFAKLFTLPSGQTVGRASIDDDGHVIAAPAVWAGELHVAPARVGAVW